jgi:predicted amidohydrolase
MAIVRVAAVQMDVHLAEVQRNLDSMIDRFREASAEGAALVVFPECALTGYCFSTRAEASAVAEPTSGPSFERLGGVCAELGAHVVIGHIERDGDRLYNACSLVGPQGVVGTYRKVHLPSLGLDKLVDPGDRPFAVHEADGLRIGMHICYDGGFPEAGRVMSLLGADLLVLPTNWPTHAETAAAHLMPCRALENTVYAMAVNRVGEERGFTFIGRSSIAAPNGETLAFGSPDREEILFADVDTAVARQKHLVRRPGLHEINRFADRRPRFYSQIVEPNGKD